MKRISLICGILLGLVLGGAAYVYLTTPVGPPKAEDVEKMATEFKAAESPPDVTPELQALISAYENSPAEARESTLLNIVLEKMPENLTPLLARIRTLEDVEQRRMLEKVLIRTWGMKETPLALEYTTQLGDADLAQELVKAIIRDWAQRDLIATQNYVLALPDDSPYRTEAMIALIGELAKASPREAYELTRTRMEEPLRTDWSFALFPVLTKTDLKLAGEAFLELPEDERRGQVLVSLIDTWRPQDLDGLLAWLAAMPDTHQQARDLGYSLVIDKWAREDPEAAGEFVAKMPGGDLRTNMAGLVANAWAAQDGRAALDWVSTLPDGRLQRLTANAVFTSWAQADAVAAAQFAGMLPHNAVRENAFGVIAPLLAEHDIRDAADWVSVLPGATPGRLDAVEGLVTVWLRKDGSPEEIYSFVGTLPKEVRDDARVRFYRAWARTKPAIAVGSADKLPDGKVRDKVLPEVFATWARKSPKQAAASADTMPNSELRHEVKQAIARVWTLADLEAVRAWAETQENAEDQAVIQQMVLERWSVAEPDKAIAWLGSMEEGKARDGLIESAAVALVKTDASGTISLVESIKNEKQRQAALEAAAAAWLQASPGPARIWIEQSSLSAETKNKLLGGS